MCADGQGTEEKERVKLIEMLIHATFYAVVSVMKSHYVVSKTQKWWVILISNLELMGINI